MILEDLFHNGIKENIEKIKIAGDLSTFPDIAIPSIVHYQKTPIQDEITYDIFFSFSQTIKYKYTRQS